MNHALEENREKFNRYKDLLLEWNQKINLTSITDPQEIETKHFLDSLSLLPFIPNGVKALVDIGSGAGFPGIPIAIVRPDLQITLIESIGKKAKFLEMAADVLELSNVEVVCARAEDAGKHQDYKEKFDVATARAVAKLDKLAGFALPLIKKGGLFLAPKSAAENPDDALSSIEKYGGEILKIEKIEIPGLSQRVIILIRKS